MNNNDSESIVSNGNGNGNVKVEVNGDISNVKINGEVNANETNTKTETETSNLLQSFATFCVSVLLKPTIVIIGDGDSVEDVNDNVINAEECQDEDHHVDHHHHHHHHTTIYEQRICESIEEVANAYINGDDTDIPIETLFKRLLKIRIEGNTNTKDDKLIDDDDDDDDPLLLPSSSTSVSSYRRTDLELFTNDIEDCLENTLLHEYLSANWDRIDDLIRVNEHQQKQSNSSGSGSKNKGNFTATPNNNNEQQLEQEKDQHGFCCRSSTRCNWEQTRKSYFKNRIMNDVHLKNIRKFRTMSTILRSVQQEQEEEELKEEEEQEELEQKHGNSRSSSTSTTKNNSTNDDIFFPYQQRHPTVYFLGGGMGAGKSSVVAYLKEQHDEMFTNNPIVVEADAFKHSDPIFQALKAFNNQNKERHNDNEQQQTRKKHQPVKVSQLVHEHSTDAANQQLVVALANQRDIVVDGTMTWLPYVQQTIDMVRDAHKHRYLLGPGYNNSNKKTITKKETATETETVIDEQYWIQVEPIDEDRLFLPYRVEMVGVTIDPEYAVSRGIRRAIITGRGVPIRGQLRSHRLYSENFPIYCNNATNNNKCLFDRIRLFDNSTTPTATTTTKTSTINDDDTSATIQKNQHQRQRQRPPPRCIAWKESMDQPLSVIPDAYAQFLKKQRVNDSATGVVDLYNTSIQTNVDSDSNMNDIEAIEEKEGSSLALPLSQNSLTYVPSNIVIHWRLREVFSMANRK